MKIAKLRWKFLEIMLFTLPLEIQRKIFVFHFWRVSVYFRRVFVREKPVFSDDKSGDESSRRVSDCDSRLCKFLLGAHIRDKSVRSGSLHSEAGSPGKPAGGPDVRTTAVAQAQVWWTPRCVTFMEWITRGARNRYNVNVAPLFTS